MPPKICEVGPYALLVTTSLYQVMMQRLGLICKPSHSVELPLFWTCLIGSYNLKLSEKDDGEDCTRVSIRLNNRERQCPSSFEARSLWCMLST